MGVAEIAACRACGGTDLPQVLDLGELSVSGFPLPGEQVETAPLEVVRCRACSLAQLRHTVPRERLFSEHYYYRSGTQEAMVAALRDVADHARALVPLKARDRVLDIGANDGTLLRMFPQDTVRIGFEPAFNLYEEGTQGGNLIFPGFWPPTLAAGQVIGLAEQQAKIITSIACFYDADDPGAFVEGVKRWLHPDGVWINQLAYLPKTLERGNIGDFVHEHLTYWSGYAMERLLQRHGLQIVDSAYNEVNGGSMRYIIRHDSEPVLFCGDDVSEQDWDQFRYRLAGLRYATVATLVHLKRQGKQVLGYAAATKFNTVLQHFDIGPDLVAAVADRNPEKWGRVTTTGIPIISEDEMRARRPDVLLVGAWHFLDAFMQRETDFLARGGRFLTPFPTLRFVGGTREPCLSAQVA